MTVHTPTRTWVMQSDGSMSWRVPVEAFVPVARGLFVSALFGVGLFWPAWRLSQPTHPSVGIETAVDAAALWLVAQVVIWPMRLLMDFSVSRLTWIGVTLGVWTFVFALLVWAGRLSNRGGARLVSGVAAIHWL